MTKLIKYYEQYKGQLPLFNTIEIFDWYDGAITGLGALKDSDEHYLFNLRAWDANSHKKIFMILETDNHLLQKLEMKKSVTEFYALQEELENYFLHYKNKLFVFVGEGIDAKKYFVKEIPLYKLKYTPDIETAVYAGKAEYADLIHYIKKTGSVDVDWL